MRELRRSGVVTLGPLALALLKPVLLKPILSIVVRAGFEFVVP